MKSGWNWASENPRARLWWHNHAGRSIHPRFVQDLLRILDSLQLPLIGETADPRQQRSLMLGHSVWYLRLSPAKGCPTSTGLFPRDLFLMGQLLKSRSSPKYSDDGVDLRLIPPVHTSPRRILLARHITTRSFAAGGPLGLVASGRKKHLITGMSNHHDRRMSRRWRGRTTEATPLLSWPGWPLPQPSLYKRANDNDNNRW